MVPLFGIPVGPEILLIVLIVVLLFGASKIPELARATGEATGEFQKGRQEIEEELESDSPASPTDPDDATETDDNTDTDTDTDDFDSTE